MMTVIDMQDATSRKYASVAGLKYHVKLMSKGMKHSKFSMNDVLSAVERELHEGKKVYARSRKGCEQAAEACVMFLEDVLSQLSAGKGQVSHG